MTGSWQSSSLSSAYERAAMTHIHVTYSDWVDLVFHVLSYVETVPGDHSSLRCPAYADWAGRHGLGSDGVESDAQRRALSRLYREGDRSHLIHFFPLLWDSIDAFLVDSRVPFEAIPWTTPARAHLAAQLLDSPCRALLQPFVLALRQAAESGFAEIWQSAMVPQTRAYVEAFKQGIADLSRAVRGLHQVSWVLSFPLCRHGRLCCGTDSKSCICVGVADETLGIGPTHPMIQGCHEFLLLQMAFGPHASDEIATVPGAPGYEEFSTDEERALSLGERLLAHGPWGKAYHEWRLSS